MTRQTLEVTGMSCTGCEANVEDALAGVEGVTGVSAHHDTDTVEIDTEADVDDATIHETIEDAGYEVTA